MKTTEKIVDKSLSPNIPDCDTLQKNNRPLQSLRPMKSMVRVKSFRPQKIELNKSRRKVIKL